MFERYAPEATSTIFQAKEEARRCGSLEIEPQHLLLALATSDPKLLARLNVNGSTLRNRIAKDFPSRAPHTTKQIALDTRSQRSLAFAAQAMHEDSRKYLTTGHILIGLLRENGYALGRYVGVSCLSFDRIPRRIAMVCRQWQAP